MTATETELPTLRHAGLTYRLPFASELPSLPPDARAELRDSIERKGVMVRVETYDSLTHGKRCLLDGRERLTLAEDLGISVPICHRGLLTDEDAHERFLALNLARRHLSEEELIEARQHRNSQIIADRAAGDSLREIAKRFGLHHETVSRILEAAVKAGVALATPHRVNGTDGKSYPASMSRPLPDPVIVAGRQICRFRDAIETLLATPFAARINAICVSHKLEPQTLTAVLADLAAAASQPVES